MFWAIAMNQKLSIAQANLKLALWNSEAELVKSSELYIQLQELGLPEEVVSRLHEILTYTKKVAGRAFSVLHFLQMFLAACFVALLIVNFIPKS